jgi:hypothetical protein
MNPQWYISRSRPAGGVGSREKVTADTVGPMSTANLLEMATHGWAAADDLVLQEGTDVQITVDQFLAMARNGTLPGGTETAPATPPRLEVVPSKGNCLPEWLTDVNQLECTPQSKIPEALTWLEDIRQIEESLCRSPTPPNIPTAIPVTAVTAAPATPPIAPPSVQRDQRGYDLETGQILDAVAYARWQKAEAERRQEAQQQAPASVAEVFLQAQRAIQEWVDADANKPLVISGDRYTIRHCPSAQALMRRFEAYGPVMQGKLWMRLFFLVDNRKKYYQATR